MSQSDVEMSQYREDQTLLSANPLTMPPIQNIQASSTTILPQPNTETMLPAEQPPPPAQVAPQQPNGQANPVIQVRPPLRASVPAFLCPVLLDIIFFLYCVYSLCFGESFSIYLLIWTILYILNVSAKGIKQPIPRILVVVLSLWQLFVLMYNHFDLASLSTSSKVFLIVYMTEVLPLICKGCCACFCTCMCATCCICVCIGALISQACQGYMEKNKYKKARETLCNRELREINDVQCAICLETGDKMNTQVCHHSFHPVCLDNWLKAHKTCPLCRGVLY